MTVSVENFNDVIVVKGTNKSGRNYIYYSDTID